MNAISFEEITKLPDRDLVDRIHTLADREREAKAALIAHLAIMDERRLYLGEGCSSLFTYCVRVLHFSEAAAYRRVEAVHAARRFPAILDMLSTGQINLTTIRLLAPELTPTNHQDLLKKATHQSRLEVEKIVAHLRPQAPVTSTVRQLPTRTAALASHPLRGEGSEAAADATPSVSGTFPTLVRPAAPPVVVPLSPKFYKIQFTASEETHDLLRRAQDLLRHQIPNGDVGEVIAKALRLLVKHLEQSKVAATDHPRGRQSSKPGSRHIAAEVRRKVWERDAGQCAFVAHNGRRCTERTFLEFHHVVPYAAGGEATDDNIQLRCRGHNSYEAKLTFELAGLSVRAGPP